MFILKKVYLGIILSVVVLVICEDEKKAEEEEEKDPWDTSTDKYRHHLGNSKSSDTEEPVKIDVTEVSESEVHSSRSKLCKNCKTQAVVREEPNIDNSTKLHNSSLESRNIRKEIDEETKEQIKDAIDERDPADSEPKDTKTHTKHHGGTKKHGLSKKQLNHQIDFYPGSLWEYPYPYYHPQYGCGGKKGPCTPEAKPIEAKEDKTKKDKNANAHARDALPRVKVTGKKTVSKEKDAKAVAALPIRHDKKKEKVSGSVFPKIKGFGWIWKGPRVSEIGTSWGTPCWFNQEKKQFTCRQLVPSHYYGPPSAGWGGFQPGHTGGGWGTPYWYKKCAVPQRDCRQIIPSHYYGPPSAGWGGFQPGHTGGGWGTPYWYKRCLVPQKHCRQLIPVHYYGPPSAGWGGFQPGQTGGGWGTPHWNKRCETPQLNCRGYIPSPYQPNWLAGSSSIRSTDPWSQSLYGNPMINDQPSRKWNVLSDYQGVGHIEKENGGWDSGLGAGHGLSSWGEANQFGSFPNAMHEECNKINQGIKQGYCDESVGSCEKMHDYLPDQHDPVDEDHCGVRPQFLYNDNVGKVEYEQNGVLQISKGHEDETTVDVDGTKGAGEWSGKKKNDIAKKRLMSHAIRIMMKRKRRRKLLRGKTRNGHRRTKIFKNQGNAGSKVLKASNQTSMTTKSTIHSSTKRKKYEEKSKKKYVISPGTDTGMFDPRNNNLGRGYDRFTDSQWRGQAPVERTQDMQTCGRRFPLEYCAWHAPHNLVSEGWGGHGWVGPYPNEMHTHDHHDADPSGYGAMGAIGHEMKVGEVNHLAYGPETVHRFHTTVVAPRPGTDVDMGNGYHDGDRGFHNEVVNVGEKTMEGHMDYPNQQFSNQFNGNSYGAAPAFQAIPEGMRTAHPVLTNTMMNQQAGPRVMMTASRDGLASMGPDQQAVSGNMMPEPQGVSYTMAPNQQVVSDNMMTGPHAVSGNIISGPNSIHDTVMAGAHDVSNHLMNYENNDHHINEHDNLQTHTAHHLGEPLPLPRGHVDINDVHHVGTVGFPIHDRYSNDGVHHVPNVHHMQSYPEYPENGQYFGLYRGPVSPNNPPGSVVMSNPHEELSMANTQSEGPVFPYRNDEITMITHDGLPMNNLPDGAQTNEFPDQRSMSDSQPENMMHDIGPFQGQPQSFNEYDQPVQETNVETNMQHFSPNSEENYEPNLRHNFNPHAEENYEPNLRHNFNPHSEENYEPNLRHNFNHHSEGNYEPNLVQHFNPQSEQNYNGHMESSQQEHVFIGPHSNHVPMHSHSASVRDNTLVEGRETDEFAKRTRKNTSLPMKREKQVPVAKKRSRKKGRLVKLIQIDNMIPIKTVPVHVTKFSVSKPVSNAPKENEGNRRTKRSLTLDENHLSKSKSIIHRKNSGKKWTIDNEDGQDHSNTLVDGFHAPQEYQLGDTGTNLNDFDDDHMGGDNRMETCRLTHSAEHCAWQANRELGGLRHDEDFGGIGWIGNFAKQHGHEPEHVHTETNTEYSTQNTPNSEVTAGELHHVTASVPEHHEIPDPNIEVGEIHHILTNSPEQHHHLEGTTASSNEHINIDEVNSVESVDHIPFLQQSLHHSNTGEYNHEGDLNLFHNDTGSYSNADNHEGDPFHNEHNDIGSDLHGEHGEGNTFNPHHDYDYFGGDHHDGHHNIHNDGEVGISHDHYDPLGGPKVETSEANHLETAPDRPVVHDSHPNDDSAHVFVDTGVGTVPLADHPASVVADGSIQDDTERDEFAKRTGNATHYKRH